MQTLKVPALATSWPVLAAIGLNLIPVIGVLFWGWSVFALMLLYWLENLVIGARTVASMLASGLSTGPVSVVGALALGAFFTVHYGLFCFVHGVFVVSLFGDSAVRGDAFDLIAVVRSAFAHSPNLAAGLLSIVLWQGVHFVLFLLRGEARTANPMMLMAQPYPRIMVLHVTIIFGGFLVMLLNQPVAGVLLLALLKAGFDVSEGRREARASADGLTPNAP